MTICVYASKREYRVWLRFQLEPGSDVQDKLQQSCSSFQQITGICDLLGKTKGARRCVSRRRRRRRMRSAQQLLPGTSTCIPAFLEREWRIDDVFVLPLHFPFYVLWSLSRCSSGWLAETDRAMFLCAVFKILLRLHKEQSCYIFA